MPLNKACIAKQYPPVEATVTLEALQKYARAYDHDNPFFFDEHKPGAIIAPPMYGVVPIWQSIVQVVGDPEVGADLLRLVHGEHEVEFFVPMRPGDVITSAATIRSITTGATGETLAIEIPARNQRGELVQNTIFTAFIRPPEAAVSTARHGKKSRCTASRWPSSARQSLRIRPTAMPRLRAT